jgi:hypothetical protein
MSDRLGCNDIAIDILREVQRNLAKSEATMLAEIKWVSAQVVAIQKEMETMKHTCK